MNDPGLGEVISNADDAVHGTLRMQDNVPDGQQGRESREIEGLEPQDSEDGEEVGLYQPTLWWFTSTAFPLMAGTFGPIANLFSVCALVQTWRVYLDNGERVPDPSWLTALNACSLFLALFANITLLFNFARRIPYAVAQPITITLWYLSSILLVIPIGLTHNDNVDAFTNSHVMAYSQSYYYALISSIVYATISTLLLVSTLGSTVFHRYPASFSTLTVPQRTLMLQTISFSLYLALGGGIYAAMENWLFTDAIYWALYTLLTIGLGTDFPLTTVLGRMLLIPYAAVGITLVGLVVSSVRGLVLERAKAKVARRYLSKEREKWERNILHRRNLYEMHKSPSVYGRIQEKRMMKRPQKLQQESLHALTHKDQLGKWHRAEFELMRYIDRNAASAERYTSLASSFVVILIVWSGGSLVFWSCEHKSQGWTFPDSLYFSYTTLLTIGYGDFYPSSSAGKSFFVIWSLISIPAMTVLISNMGDTVVKLVQDVTVWISKWTILPERHTESDRRRKKRKQHGIKHRLQSRVKGGDDGSEQGHSDLERDIEHMGSRVEKFEKDEGTPNSLAARLAREISHLATDLSASPPKKYSWDEWTRWLDMLGERSDGSSSNRQDETEFAAFPVMNVDTAVQPPPKARSIASSQHGGAMASSWDGENSASESPCLLPPPTSASSIAAAHQDRHTNSSRRSSDVQYGPSPLVARRQFLEEQGHSGPGPNLLRSRHSSSSRSKRRHDWRWTWLSDEGPLFSRKSETEWIMERLCFRLEEVLEDEIREARGKSSPRQKEDSRRPV